MTGGTTGRVKGERGQVRSMATRTRPDHGPRTSHADTRPAPTNHHTDRYTNRWA